MSNTTRQKDTGAPLKPGMTPGSFSAFEADEPVFHSLTASDMQRYLDLATTQARRRLARIGRASEQHLVEDVAQTAVVQFLDAIDKRPPLAFENTDAYLNQIVSNTVSAETSPVSKAARSGLVVLTEKAEAMERELNRKLTRLEYEALGKKIWDEWPADKPKPPKNFYEPQYLRQVQSTDLDTFVEVASMEDVFGNGSHTHDPSSYEETMGQWSKILLNESQTTSAASERLFRYNAFAEQMNLPLVIPPSITRNGEITARREINKVICDLAGIDDIKDATDAQMAAGVHSVFKAVAEGNIHPAEDALFLPWSRPIGPKGENGSIPTEPLDTDGRIAIAEEMVKYPQQSYALWKSALSMADATNYDRVLKAIARRDEEVGAA